MTDRVFKIIVDVRKSEVDVYVNVYIDRYFVLVVVDITVGYVGEYVNVDVFSCSWGSSCTGCRQTASLKEYD